MTESKQTLKEKREKRKQKNQEKKENYKEDSKNLNNVCRDFMKGSCERVHCRFIHDNKLCNRYWQNEGSCKFKHNCRKNHFVTLPIENTTNIIKTQDDKLKNSQRRGDDLTNKFVDMNIIVTKKFDPTKINERDVLIVSGLLDGTDITNQIEEQLKNINNDVFQLWHNDCHRIANDKCKWRDQVPIFNEIIDKMKNHFQIDVQATRLNIFDYSQFKYYHRDRAAFDKKTAEKQNFTICLNLGTTRTIAFRNVKTKTIISIPLNNGDIYCFAKKINEEWEHAVLKETQNIETSKHRMSIVIWGKI